MLQKILMNQKNKEQIKITHKCQYPEITKKNNVSVDVAKYK